MTPDEKAALVWLEGCMRLAHGGERHADVIRAMLDRSNIPAPEHAPLTWLEQLRRGYSEAYADAIRMPEEPTDAAIAAMDRAFFGDLGSRPSLWRGVYRALRDELSKPMTRTVTTWEVRYAIQDRTGIWHPGVTVCNDRAGCERFRSLHEGSEQYACWSIVGPIERVVPA